MNENENKTPNHEETNPSPDGEVTKALGWEWTEDKNSANESSETSEVKAAEEDVSAESTEETVAESEENTETPSEEETTSESSEETDKTPEDIVEDAAYETVDETAEEQRTEIATEPTAEMKKTEHKQKNTALLVSSILSACSIVLLVALSLGLMLGIIPVSSNIIYNPTVNNTPTQPDVDASPSLIEDCLNSVVVVTGNGITSTSTGTGVIISTDGYIVTNYHVIEKCATVNVSLFGEKTAEKATVVGFHKEDDIAVLKINRTGLRAAGFVDSDAVRYGEKVYAIGTPEGSDYGWSVTQGIVSSPRRQLMIYDEEGVLEKKMNVVQTDASVNHGNSGGPIINIRGEVVGIVTLKRTNSAGMGFALPASGVLKVAKAIIETGSADNVESGISMPRPLLGITGVGVQKNTFYENYTNAEGSGVQVVDEEYAKTHPSTTFYAPVAGVHVSATSAGSDASTKLQVNDIITEVNGNTVSTIYHVMNIINEYNGGDSVTVKFYRGGKYYTVDITLGAAE